MAKTRQPWQSPALSEVSVNEVLGSGDGTDTVLGPPGWASPGPLITGPMPAGLFNGRTAVLGPPIEGLTMNFTADGPRLPDPSLGPIVPGLLPLACSDGPPIPESDIRLKEEVRHIGETAHGLPLYTFRYRGQEGLYEGVMAQDVLLVRPDAVLVGADGFYRVDYDRLGIVCRRLQ